MNTKDKSKKLPLWVQLRIAHDFADDDEKKKLETLAQDIIDKHPDIHSIPSPYTVYHRPSFLEKCIDNCMSADQLVMCDDLSMCDISMCDLNMCDDLSMMCNELNMCNQRMCSQIKMRTNKNSVDPEEKK